jgi:hypothetical protein
VISAGVLPRWKPLTHPHHAQSATSPTTLEVRRVPTGPVYLTRHFPDEPSQSRADASPSSPPAQIDVPTLDDIVAVDDV